MCWQHGRAVRDGGGIEADVKVPAPTSSLIEVLLTQRGVIFDFASQWCRSNPPPPITNMDSANPSSKPLVTDAVYSDFKRFVMHRVQNGDLEAEDVYAPLLRDLEQTLRATDQTTTLKAIDELKANIEAELRNDLTKHETELRAAISDAILSRYGWCLQPVLCRGVPVCAPVCTRNSV